MQFFEQSYPFYFRGKILFNAALTILISAFLFGFLFRPFNVEFSEHKFAYWVICLIHAGSGSLIFAGYYLVMGLVYKRNEWKMLHEVSSIIAVLFLIGTGSFLWREVIYDNPNNVSWRYFGEELVNTFLIGSLIILLIQIRLNSNNKEIFNTEEKDNLTDIGQSLLIKTQVEADDFEIDPTRLIAARSEGNYVEFFIDANAASGRCLKRITLQSTLDQLSAYSFIIKTHRAYLVNMTYVEKTKGNSQGYKLTVKNIDFSVPVSRGHVTAFDTIRN